jgi:hypothetical protein
MNQLISKVSTSQLSSIWFKIALILTAVFCSIISAGIVQAVVIAGTSSAWLNISSNAQAEFWIGWNQYNSDYRGS